ncbi:acyl-CoA dehydrogenase [Micrococcus luteus]|uniref:Acyl-CoA dehydrogenase n=1 Tax=Micrococcus luteus (strain ATCC 4698 / DSM 20030 / JCM 1464 / CCM 169 / CCUG 5858 / IAM 1056 / NBRC 3333 / NCIMB 9278 / NCTC 2665 / VKM Ac-2230) TaxID=465515 RepID=C5C6U9_MICLC|nr:acyl-CoA dehydrogenase family protein [Micrococcus luteus]ACS31437.1 acyl-CoA dehydrogenase [Micrococcus luteus NCTC 2665]AJO56492.1 acyl-CoA dehydrogenase [Micrococcus luteus]KAB1901470.1 acyl-CoA dehydrogenase [Micrococcus luteus NCTC 2665]ORE61788.1 acyl-CoA dehydrogenase [Micrococcus luteus]QCY44742.1 acyl-CoA dehydrogenase [Micrococcus luteus]
MTRRQKPTYDVVTPLDVDYLDAFGEATDEDRTHWDRARAYGREVLERIDGHWDRAEYPLDLVARAGELDLLTDGLEVPGHAVMSPLAAGLVAMEISRADGSMAAAAAVQGGLVLRALVHCAGPEQKERYLAPVARGTLPGGFALTEPLHGSDSVSLETSARPDGAGGWVLNGAKKWIGNGAAGGITIVWARDTEDGQVKGFVVEQSTPGYEAEVITGKGALRAIHQAEITLTDVRVGDDARLPGVATFKDAARVLVATRVNVGWSALGHATAMFEAALAYARQREQFGKPLGAHQMVQERLAQMLDEVTAMQTRCVAVARLQAAGRLRDEQASLLKYACTRGARRVAQIARDMLGGNGILLEHRVMRHFADVEALHTYEGTESVQALILGRDLTGYSAFA